jgi:hypothetical protein
MFTWWGLYRSVPYETVAECLRDEVETACAGSFATGRHEGAIEKQELRKGVESPPISGSASDLQVKDGQL